MAGPVTGGNHWLNATVRLDSKNPIANSNRGDTLRAQGQYGRSIADFWGGDPRNSTIARDFRGLAFQELAT